MAESTRATSEAEWRSRFMAALRTMDATYTEAEAAWAAEVVYMSAHLLNPEEMAWKYVGLADRRSVKQI